MKPCLTIILTMFLWTTLAFADSGLQVNVVALFADKAVIIVNKGKPQTLSAGQKSTEGIKLLTANSLRAVLEIEGKRRELGMGQAATVLGANLPEGGSAVLYADSSGHHFIEGLVNGARMRMLVDTGATAIAMNASDAKRAGLDYKKGDRSEVQTANGVVQAYHVVINTLKLGSLTLNQVDALVMEGDSPAVVLLGMSALNRMEMKREGIALTLTKKY